MKSKIDGGYGPWGLGFGGLALLACASGPPSSPPPELPPAGPDGEYVVEAPEMPEQEPREITLDLGADLAQCEVEAPRFPYDESKPLPQEIPELRRLANCLNTEPFSDFGVLLVGRADERGDDQYNRKLGQRRAEFVKQRLKEYGVAEDRIVLTSEGEKRAVGDKEWASHGYDRRVDIIQLRVVAP